MAIRKKRIFAKRGRPKRLRSSEFHTPNSSIEGALRVKSASRDRPATNNGSMADIIKQVASRKQRRDSPF